MKVRIESQLSWIDAILLLEGERQRVHHGVCGRCTICHSGSHHCLHQRSLPCGVAVRAFWASSSTAVKPSTASSCCCQRRWGKQTLFSERRRASWEHPIAFARRLLRAKSLHAIFAIRSSTLVFLPSGTNSHI